MLKKYDYNRDKAVSYALKWALNRNPDYLDFERLGGDCTNFISQCILAGTGIMNFTPVYGWYYTNSANRTASWTGVEYLHKFLVNNEKEGPFAEEVPLEEAMLGDIIQLGDSQGRFYHSLVVTRIDGEAGTDTIHVSAHTFDVKNRPLQQYSYNKARCLQIKGMRKWDS